MALPAHFTAVQALAFAVMVAGCGRSPDDLKAREALHALGFSFTVGDFVRAAAEGKEAVVRHFLEAGMHAGAAAEDGGTALFGAAGNGHGGIVRLLLAHGAPPHPAGGRAPLMAAARGGDAGAVTALLEAGADPEFRDADGFAPLTAAVAADQCAVVEVLASRTPAALDMALQLASKEGHTSVMAVLMEKGASPHSAALDGRTPLMFAAAYGHDGAVRLLRRRGAAVTALDNTLKTAAMHAEENGHMELAAALTEPESAPEALPDLPPPRISDADWSGLAIRTLDELAAQVHMTDYCALPLPVMLLDVAEGDGSARVRILTGEVRDITVTPGMGIGETGLTAERMRRRIKASKAGSGRRVNVSDLLLRESPGERRHLAVKDQPALSSDTCAIITLADARCEVRRGDRFTAGTVPVKVIDIRPSQIVMERTDSHETVTVRRGG